MRSRCSTLSPGWRCRSVRPRRSHFSSAPVPATCCTMIAGSVGRPNRSEATSTHHSSPFFRVELKQVGVGRRGERAGYVARQRNLLRLRGAVVRLMLLHGRYGRQALRRPGEGVHRARGRMPHDRFAGRQFAENETIEIRRAPLGTSVRELSPCNDRRPARRNRARRRGVRPTDRSPTHRRRLPPAPVSNRFPWRHNQRALACRGALQTHNDRRFAGRPSHCKPS